VFIERARDGTIMLFEYPLDRFREHRLVVTRDASAWVARLDARAVDRVPVALSNTVRGSLWAAADGVGLSADNIVALASIFEWEIDFNTQVQNGDRFRLIVLEVRDRATGEALRYADILAAEYQNGATPHRAVRYEDRAGDVGFFDDEGMSTRKMFLKSPLKFSRISSGFSKSRFHPVKQEWRAHKGTDFAAASGTPVRAIGAGRVEFAGTKGGYGKHVRVKHQGKYGSSYSHLSRIAVRSGQGVSQGDLVGYVGATGLATGPHLHFEFYVNGGQVDFMRQTFPRTEPIDDAERPRFLVIAGQMFPQLDSITFREAEAGDDDSADSDSAPP
jgi:murein DD-endopeptidase MepM/ murein hydrolase activator NlpD